MLKDLITIPVLLDSYEIPKLIIKVVALKRNAIMELICLNSSDFWPPKASI